MRRPKIIFLVLALLSISTLAFLPKKSPKAAPPNIVYILADDLGYGDVGAYGQKKIKTPNLDKMAADGLLFTSFYAGSTVCAPSRNSLMTGQHTGHSYIRGNGEIPLRAGDKIMPQYLQEQGYATGMFGKWGLGDMNTPGMPDLKGWDTFVGFLHHIEAHFQFPGVMWRFEQGQPPRRERERLPWGKGFANDHLAEQALKFIDDNRKKPFFLYLSLTIPHAELVTTDEILSRYRDKDGESMFGPEKDFPGTHYGGQKHPRAAYAAMVSRIDDYVGDVRAKLAELGLEDNTLIFFTSDNGTHVEGGRDHDDVDFFQSSGPLRGVKRDMYEGGIRVPGIACWKGTVKAGRTTDFAAANWDWLPTVLELSGSKARPGDLDGTSLVSLFRNNQVPNVPDRTLYWEFHERGFSQCLRQGDWKVIRFVNENQPVRVELYNLADDIGERNDRAAAEPARLKRMVQLLDDARTKSVHPAFVTLGY